MNSAGLNKPSLSRSKARNTPFASRVEPWWNKAIHPLHIALTGEFGEDSGSLSSRSASCIVDMQTKLLIVNVHVICVFTRDAHLYMINGSNGSHLLNVGLILGHLLSNDTNDQLLELALLCWGRS